MAVYHARLLRSLSCVLGAHTRERDMREKEREGGQIAREKGEKREGGGKEKEAERIRMEREIKRGGNTGIEYYTYAYK